MASGSPRNRPTWQQSKAVRLGRRVLSWVEDWPPFRLLDYLGPKAATVLGLLVGGVIVGLGIWPSGPLHYGWLGLGVLLGLGLVVSAKPVARPQPLPLPGESLLDMVPVEGGWFVMGSPPWEKGRDSDERWHPVKLTPFRMSRTPVTGEQYRRVMGESPGPWGDQHPVTEVSWFDAIAFCNRISAIEELPLCYEIEGDLVRWIADEGGYRLPTEAEWEYAARAGSVGAWPFLASQLDQHARHAENSDGRAHPVAELEPNPWGLYDLHGNVWEWCWDLYGPYGWWMTTDPQDPGEFRLQAPEGDDFRSKFRVLRGGSYGNELGVLRSANRNWFGPEIQGRSIAFRCVRRSPPDLAG